MPLFRPQEKVGSQARNHQDIRKELNTSGQLFEDNEFPAVDQTIFYSHALPKRFEWKRPHVSRLLGRVTPPPPPPPIHQVNYRYTSIIKQYLYFSV